MEREALIDSPYQYHTLDSGLRIVHLHRSNAAVGYLGVAIKAGSSDDLHHPGLAHFVEHTIFKGTTTRTSAEIIDYIESVGGELNAYTTKDETMVYSAFPEQYLDRAMTLIADLILNSTFPDHEIDRERRVIIEEIDSYLDSPSESVFDDFEDIMFKGTPWGHNILGTKDSVTEIDSRMCRQFIERNYHRLDNLVLFYSGPASINEIIQMAGEHFTGSTATTSVIENQGNCFPAVKPFDIRRTEADTHQSHTIMGALTPGIETDMRFTLSLLNNILGGPAMNSRLNIELREQRGLVYNVDSSVNLYRHFGAFNIYFGCSKRCMETCRQLVLEQLDSFRRTPLTDTQLEAAKRQYAGQLTVASASPEQNILSAARATLWHGHANTIRQIRARIDSITPTQIVEAAQLIAPDKISTLTLG